MHVITICYGPMISLFTDMGAGATDASGNAPFPFHR